MDFHAQTFQLIAEIRAKEAALKKLLPDFREKNHYLVTCVIDRHDLLMAKILEGITNDYFFIQVKTSQQEVEDKINHLKKFNMMNMLCIHGEVEKHINNVVSCLEVFAEKDLHEISISDLVEDIDCGLRLIQLLNDLHKFIDEPTEEIFELVLPYSDKVL